MATYFIHKFNEEEFWMDSDCCLLHSKGSWDKDGGGETVLEPAASFYSVSNVNVVTASVSRGKLTGHDVDFLITHPEEGREVGLMPKVVSWLQSQVNRWLTLCQCRECQKWQHFRLSYKSSFLSLQGFLLYQKTTRNSYLESKTGPAQPPSNMDRFERCFSVFKLEKKEGTKHSETHAENGVQNLNTTDTNPPSCSRTVGQIHSGEHSQGGLVSGHKLWRAVRVDLVVSPISQFAFALLGWTGSKVTFNTLSRIGCQNQIALSCVVA